MARLILSPLFGDHAVFPKGLPIRVFGESDTAGSVTLALQSGDSYHADFTPTDGRFTAYLPAIDSYESNAVLTVTAGDITLTATDVAVGIVLLAAGQSNMEWAIKDSVCPLPLTRNAKVRLYQERHNMDGSGTESEYAGGDEWYIADGVREKAFSAIGFFVAHILAEKLSVTVGVISCNKGGSRIESWISPAALRESGIDPAVETPYPDASAAFNRDHWLYLNKYVNVAPYAVSFVLWYQGESNVGFGEGEYYGDYLHTLIADWRQHQENPHLSFYLVEIAAFDSIKAGWADVPLGSWAPVREAIVAAPARDADVYAVSLTDTGEDTAVIHPVHKYPVAEKLSHAILASQFGYDCEYTGPVLATAVRDGDRLTVGFSHGDGLHFADFMGNAEDARDFFFLMQDGTKRETAVTIEKDRLTVSIPDSAAFFCMGYHDTPRHNLYNSADYLASPFRIALSEL